MIRIILTIILGVLLTSCSVGSPNQTIVKQAIALQLNQTQQELGAILNQDASQRPQFTIRRITITHRQSLTIQSMQSHHILGTYDLQLQFAKRQVTKRNNPFDLYLQQQADKTWRLARSKYDRDPSQEQWETTLIE